MPHRHHKMTRPLSLLEKDLVRRVFGTTLERAMEKTVISNTLGLGGRQYVTPAIFGFQEKDGKVERKELWVVHMGPKCYLGLADLYEESVFVHEMTHVWQSYYSKVRWSYAIESGAKQSPTVALNWMTRGHLGNIDKLYRYDVNDLKAWSEYNPEQQASIVQDWYYNGSNETDSDPIWRFIRDHIRLGRI